MQRIRQKKCPKVLVPRGILTRDIGVWFGVGLALPLLLNVR